MARPTDWQDTTIAFSMVSGANTSLGLVGSLSTADLRGATLIRTIVRLDFHSTTVAGAWGVHQALAAIGIISQEAFAAGVFPDPRTQDEKPPRGWIYKGSAGVAQNGVGSPVTYPLMADIRGARKIENGALFIIIDNQARNGTSFSVGVNGLVRCLIKLS